MKRLKDMQPGFHLPRRLVQFAVLLFLVLVPLLNQLRIHIFHGNLLAFNFAGIPFADPLAALQAAAGGISDSGSMLLGAGLVLLIALMLGTIFCSWLCPYGLLSELLYKKRNSEHSSQFFHFLSKALLTAVGLLLVFVTAVGPLLNQLSMPGWISRFLQHALLYREALWGGLLVVIMLALERGLGLRLWCRYLCPQSVLLSLASLILPQALQVRFTPKRCTCQASDRPCLPACSLNLNPRKPGPKQRLECTNCGDCVDACQQRGGALSLGFGPMEQAKKQDEAALSNTACNSARTARR